MTMYYNIMENLPQLLLITLVLILLSIFIYIKLAFPFWNTQPVYHPYDFWRPLFMSPFRIHSRFHPSMKSKFTYPKEVEIVPFATATEGHKKAFVNLLQCYSLETENSIFMFHLENLEAYMSGHLFASYLSFFKEMHYKPFHSEVGEVGEAGEEVGTEIVVSEKPVGCISSRSGNLAIRGHKESIYYIDFVTIARGRDIRDLSRKLFETHIYKEMLISKMELHTAPIMVSLFRKDLELFSGIVPLSRFSTRFYELPNNPNYGKKTLPEHVVLLQIDSKNFRDDLWNGIEERFSVVGITDMANLLGLIKSGVLMCYVLKKMDSILAIYIFRDTRIMEEGAGCIIELVASWRKIRSTELFHTGFLLCLGRLSLFRIIKVDGIADNGELWWGDFRPIGEYISAYYLYNMVVPWSPIPGSQVFVLF